MLGYRACPGARVLQHQCGRTSRSPRFNGEAFSGIYGYIEYASRSRLSVQCQATARHTLYDVLAVPRTASDGDIKKAFRALALKLHPDVNKEPGAEAQFVHVKQAYETLADPHSRREYDMKLARAATGYSTSTSSRGSSSSSSSGYGSVADWYKAEWVDLGDDSDEEDGWGSDDDAFEEEYINWATSGNNFGSSFTSSWEGATGRKRRANEAARRARASASGKAASGKAASTAASGSDRKGRATKAGKGADLGGLSVEELLSALGPEARLTAQKTFGRRLERLVNAAELADFLEVLETLRGDMGIEFELYSSAAAQDTYKRDAANTSPRTKAGGRTSSSPKPPKSTSSSSSAGSTRGSSVGSGRSAKSASSGVGGGAKAARTSAAGAKTSQAGAVKHTGAHSKNEVFEYFEIGGSDDEDDIVWAGISVEESGRSVRGASSSRGRRKGAR